jgi:transcriptional regulator with XRE-family HTH domain
MVVTPSVGELLRSWRVRRRMSQLDLADLAEIGVKTLGQIETGRAAASRDLVLRLAEQLGVPLRDRNALMTAAGYASLFPQRPLDDPALDFVRRGLDAMLAAQEPHPAMAYDRHWTLLAANQAFHRMVAGVDPLVLRPPVNILRLWLHPVGLAPRIANLRDWREQTIDRLRRRIALSGDSRLTDLLEEILDYPLPRGQVPARAVQTFEAAMVPFRLVTIDGTLSFYATETAFMAPLDVTLAEMTIETFYPLDPETATILGRMAETPAERRYADVLASIPRMARRAIADRVILDRAVVDQGGVDSGGN